MGKPTGFMEFKRVGPPDRMVDERLKDYREVTLNVQPAELTQQAARCMDCGIPFCHSGCPVENLIPEWNDLVYNDRWQEAIEALHTTNNFPDVTGRVCPAPCEASCVLAINSDAVTIKNIERSIADKAWDAGWIKPVVAPKKSGKKVAVIGSGPAGMAAAQQLARAGHAVDVLEKDDRIGGLLRYGIPDFKMEKTILDRRMEQMRAEGVTFHTGVHVGQGKAMDELVANYDAVVLAIGAGKPRDLTVPGREAKGVHFAMDFLRQQNKRVAGDKLPVAEDILATGKKVVVIGGGDTGADCVGTSNRHKRGTLHQFELLPKPPVAPAPETPWPLWPNKLRTSSSHVEGCERDWSIDTKEVIKDEKGNVKALRCVRLEWVKDASGRTVPKEIPGSEFTQPADLVLLAMGFVAPVLDGIAAPLKLELDPRGNVKADTQSYRSSHPKVFVAGDARRGASLVVWAIREGREAAASVDRFLRGQ